MAKNEFFQEENKEYDIFGPLFLILIGSVLLLNTTGYLSWEIWLYVVNFWPILLIIWGLELLTSNNRILKIIISFLGFVTVLTIFVLGYLHLEEIITFAPKLIPVEVIDEITESIKEEL